MKNLIIILIVLVASSCNIVRVNGEGDSVKEIFNLEQFSKVALNGSMDVNIIEGDRQRVEVIGQSNIIELLSQKVENGKWRIGFRESIIGNYDDITVNITIPNIETVSISGSGSIDLDGFNSIGQLAAAVSGSGDLTLQNIGSVDQLAAKVSGSGQVRLKDLPNLNRVSLSISGSGKVIGEGKLGKTEDLNINIGGSGKVEGYQISSANCNVSISGSGKCEVSVIDNLKASISGSGSVRYKGDPEVIRHVSGSGTVKRAD